MHNQDYQPDDFVDLGEAANADQTQIRHEYVSGEQNHGLEPTDVRSDGFALGGYGGYPIDPKATELYYREKALDLAIKANCGGTNLHGTMVTAQAFFDFLTGVEKDAPHA